MITNLDMDVLRTLTVAVDLGGFARAAERLGRSQSAVSLQMRKLEEQVGRPVFRKQGRSLATTDVGDTILDYARRILALNDEALAAARGGSIEGAVRLGLPQGFAEGVLSQVLARFARTHPAVQIELIIDRNGVLLEKLARGLLDLTLAFDARGLDGGAPSAPVPPAAATALRPVRWIAGPAFDWARRDPSQPPPPVLPLLLFEPPCPFRQIATSALDRAGVPWRVAVTSPSLAGLWAAADAGLGVTIRTPDGMPDRLSFLGPAQGLPALPAIPLTLLAASDSPATLSLKDMLIAALPLTPASQAQAA